MSFTKILLATMCVFPASSFACGGDAPREGYQGDKQALSEIVAKPLTCTFQGATVDAVVTAFAMYRCFGSPVKAELEAYNQKFEVVNVSKDGSSYNVAVQTVESAFRCQLKN